MRYVEVAVNAVVDRDGRCLVALTKAGHVTNGNLLSLAATKGLVQGGFHFSAAAQVTAHVRAYAHINSSRWREMKMRIKARDRVDLTEGHIDLGSELL